jgi:hypothetical protein
VKLTVAVQSYVQDQVRGPLLGVLGLLGLLPLLLPSAGRQSLWK